MVGGVTSAAPRRIAWRSVLSPRRIGVVYVLLILVVIFGLIRPEAFLSRSTVLIILNGAAISGIVAMGLVIPLAAGMFDVSIGYIIALSGTLVAFLVSKVSMSAVAAIGMTLLLGALVSLVNIVVVVRLRVNSLIGTLASGLVFLALTTALSNQQSITENVGQISSLLSFRVLNLSLPFTLLIVLTVLVAFVLRGTTVGRYWYAIGYDEESSRLAGIPVKRLQGWAFVVSALCAAVGGILITARVGAGSPTTGPDYLLPAFAAVFVGSTQFTPGRFNAFGTLSAVYLIETATVGLNIIGAPIWTGQLLEGVILIAAVAVNSVQRRSASTNFEPASEREPGLVSGDGTASPETVD